MNRQCETTQSTSGNYFFFLCIATKRHARYLLFRLFSLHSLPPRRLTGSKQTLSENTFPQTSSHNAYTYSRSFCGSLLSILSASSPIVTFLPTSTIDQTSLPPLLPPSSPLQKNAKNHRNNAQKETRVSTSKAESADATRQPTEGTTSYTHFFFFFFLLCSRCCKPS